MTEPLRAFLEDALPEQPVDLGADEMITDALVLFRVVDFDGQEYYRYTTTQGLSLAAAFGLIEVSKVTLADYYTRVLADGEDDD